MISTRDIVKEGDPILRETAKNVDLPASEQEIAMLKDMLQYLKNSQDPLLASEHGLRSGVGLAAPQIGVSKRMIAVHTTDRNGDLYSYGLFNPQITRHSVELTWLAGGEGCLSVDRVVPGNVPRYARITVSGYDIDGQEVNLRLRGFPSIVFQHEIDHLNGIMFYDRINKNDPFAEPEGKPTTR